MEKYKAYLTLLGFITEQCSGDRDKEWMLTESLEMLYSGSECKVEQNREPLVTSEMLERLKQGKVSLIQNDLGAN